MGFKFYASTFSGFDQSLNKIIFKKTIFFFKFNIHTVIGVNADRLNVAIVWISAAGTVIVVVVIVTLGRPSFITFLEQVL
jgi:hypothetical protein